MIKRLGFSLFCYSTKAGILNGFMSFQLNDSKKAQVRILCLCLLYFVDQLSLYFLILLSRSVTRLLRLLEASCSSAKALICDSVVADISWLAAAVS